MAAIRIDRIELYDMVIDEAAERLQKSIDSGRRLASRESAQTVEGILTR